MPITPRGLGYERLSDFQHKSEEMRSLLRVAERVAPTDCSLLILGETGVGKEWLARAIHREGPRPEGPFVPVNMAALPENLLESELFGHEKGAFTGADRSRRGQFELASGGTLFLDEVGDMPLLLQTHLLRVLEEKAIRRVGAETAIPVDTRIVAATNRDMKQAIAAREFRSDLFYRLGVVTLIVPPLRERRDDIDDIVAIALERFSRHYKRSVRTIAPQALAKLRSHSWPGNVRELLNVVERAVLLADGDEVTLADLPLGDSAVISTLPSSSTLPASSSEAEGRSLVLPQNWSRGTWKELRTGVLMDVERRYLDAVLRDSGGRIGRAADQAGYDPRSLYERMRAHGLNKDSYRGSGGIERK
jgi:DNA-binding NtrC family response regulator